MARMTYRLCAERIAAVVFALSFNSLPAWGAPPALYSQPAYESPVRGDPDDLLLLPGHGFSATDTVVYLAITDTTQLPAHPSVPARSTAKKGIADVASAAD